MGPHYECLWDDFKRSINLSINSPQLMFVQLSCGSNAYDDINPKSSRRFRQRQLGGEAIFTSYVTSVCASLQWYHISVVVSQINGDSTVCSMAYSRKVQNCALLTFGEGKLVNSPHKGPVMQKAFPCHNVPMCYVVRPITRTIIYLRRFPTGTRRNNNVIMTSKRRHDVVSTS